MKPGDRWHEYPAKDFPRYLGGDPVPVLRRRYALLALLLLICFLPRFWAAQRWDVLWGDTLCYVQASEDLERGDVKQAFQQFGLNIYPVILWGLRRLGSDWGAIGKWWSVLMATAVVLPLFGWVRRQFDDRVAVVACLCYSVHGKLVAVSPLMIRDPTFWFLLALTVYLMWRSVVEIRIRFFLAAGLTLTLAIHTRTEGWILLVPLLLWCAGRLPAAVGSRGRLIAGTAACLAVVPLSVALVNLTWLRESPHWELVPYRHAVILRNAAWSLWDRGQIAPPAVEEEGVPPQAAVTQAAASQTAASSSASPPASALVEEPPLTEFEVQRKIVVRMVKGYTYLGGVLALIGVVGWWRVFLRREHQAILLMGLALMLLIRIRYIPAGLDIRYFLPLALTASPWMALGVFQVGQWTMRVTEPLMAWGPARRVALLGVLAAVAGVLGLAEMKLPAARAMRRQMALGQWILAHVGPQQGIGGGPDDVTLVGHYARGWVAGSFDPRQCQGGSLPPLLQAVRPQVVLLWPDEANHESCEMLSETLKRQWQYRRIPDDLLPADCEKVQVLIRGDVPLRGFAASNPRSLPVLSRSAAGPAPWK